MSGSRFNKAKGDEGERIAGEFLLKAGFKILRTNFRTAHGEIDIIAENEDGGINFIEVKSRSGNLFGKPAEAVGSTKRSRIINSSKYFMSKYKNGMDKRPLSYGLIAIEFFKNNSVKLIFFENAFD